MGVYALLRERLPQLELTEKFSLARHTTIGCGGKTSAASPRNAAELVALTTVLQAERIPYYYIGAGANTLPYDGDYEGVTIRFHRMKTLTRNGKFLFAGAGVTGGALCRFAREESIGGFEPFTGIPMTVGGACAMNAGVREGHVSDLSLCVVAVENGKIRILSNADCKFGDKTSIFQAGIAVVGVLFRADSSPQEEIASRTAYFRSKRAHLPKGRSMGCTFVNPEGKSAGELIDRCGLKGLRRGGAYISDVHANFIINDGGTAADITSLIGEIKRTVYRKTGILLREEIRRFGQFT